MRHPILRPTSSQEAAGSLNSQAQCRAPPQSHSPNNEGGGFALDHSIHRDRPPQCTYSKGSSPRSPGRPKDSTPGAHLGCHLGSRHEMPHPKTHQVSVKFVFFLRFILFLLERLIYREERQRGRSSIQLFTLQATALVDTMVVQSQEPLPSLPLCSRAQRGCAVVRVRALHARYPIWAPVLFRQPCFPSSSLPVAQESSGGRPKALGPCTHLGDLEEAPSFGPAYHRPLCSLGE